MAVHRAAAQQAVVIVNVQIAAVAWEQIGDPFHFVGILGDVALDEDVRMFAGQHAARFELRFGRGRRETRRERVHLAATVVPTSDQLGAVVITRLCGVAQKLGAVAVHQHLAGHHAQIARFALGEEGVGRFLVDRAIHERGGRAARQQFFDEEARRIARIGRIGEAAFGRERVRVEPRQQTRRRRGDHVGLRIVNVRIDETRHDQLVAHLLHLGARRELRRERGIRARCDDMAVFDDQQAVLVEDCRVGRLRRVAVEGQQLCAEC